MLLTIHNLPSNTRYSDVKSLIQSRCGITEILLDNLVNEGQHKKVTLGVVEEEDAALVVRHINGLYIDGAQLYVENIRQKKASEQPYRSTFNSSQIRPMEQSGAQSLQETSNLAVNVPNMSFNQQLITPEMMQMMTQHMMGMGMCFMPQQQKTFMDNSGQAPAQIANSSFYSQQDENFRSMTNKYSNIKKNDLDKSQKSQNWRGNDETDYNSRPNTERDQRYYRNEPNKTSYGLNQSDNKQSQNYYQENQHQQSRQERSRFSPRGKAENYHEAGLSRNRSRSPHGFESREIRNFGNRYRDSSERYEDDNHQQNSQVRSNDFPPQRYGNRVWRRNDTDSSRGFNHNQKDFKDSERYNLKDKWDNRNFDKTDKQTNDWECSFAQPENQRRTGREYYDPAPSNFSDKKPVGETRKRPYPDSQLGKESQQICRKSIQGSVGNNSQSFTTGEVQTTKGPLQRAPTMENKRQKMDPPPRENAYSKVSVPTMRGNAPPWGNAPRKEIPPLMSKSVTRGIPSLMDVPFRGNAPSKSNPTSRTNALPKGNVPPTAIPTSTGLPNRGKVTSNHPNSNVRPTAIPNIMGNTSNRRTAAPPSQKMSKKQKRLQNQLRKDTTWRHQAAAHLARNVLSHLHDPTMDKEQRNTLLKAIKTAVFTRIELLLTTEINVQEPIIIMRYRQKFPKQEDKAFLLAVQKNLDAAPPKEEKEDHSINADNAVPATQVKQEISENVAKTEVPAPIKEEKAVVPSTGKLPNYPQGDKSIHRERRRQNKKEFEMEDLYDCDPLILNALETELNVLCRLIKEQYDEADGEEALICRRLAFNSVVTFRKSLKLATIKRILDIRTSLAMRVFVNGKIPPPAVISDYLRPFGVESLKKSNKNAGGSRPFFIATCSDYNGYDALCLKGSIALDSNSTLLFKPLHVVAPKPSFNSKDIETYKSLFNKTNPGSAENEFAEDFIDNDAMGTEDLTDDIKHEDPFYIDIPEVKIKQEVSDKKDDLVVDTKDFCMIGGEKYKVEDEVYEIKDTDLVDY